jgi:hypothetical protein
VHDNGATELTSLRLTSVKIPTTIIIVIIITGSIIVLMESLYEYLLEPLL